MDSKENSLFAKLASMLEQNTKGTQIGIYTIAGIGLAYAIHRVRPISKFSYATKIPKHFIVEKEILEGRIVGCETTKTSTRLLFDHKPLVRIPFWHSGKPPLPVEVWGVKPAGSNTLSWLQCIAVGKKTTVLPISNDGNTLIAQVKIHLPITPTLSVKKVTKKEKQKAIPTFEEIDVGERLIELGMGVVIGEATKQTPKDTWWMPWIVGKNQAALLQRAQSRAVSRRAGYWQEVIPASRFGSLFKPANKASIASI